MEQLRIVLTVAALLAAMGICVGIGVRRRSGPAVLILLAIVWLTLDRFFEGELLFGVTRRNGFTTSDIVAVAAVGIAIGQLVRLRQHPADRPVSVGCPRCGTGVGALVSESAGGGMRIVQRQLCPNEQDAGPAPHGPIPDAEFLLTRAG